MDLRWDQASGVLTFRTADLQGRVLANGRQHGVLELLERTTGTALTGGPLLTVYRLLCRDGWMGEAREMRHRVEPLPDGLALHWLPGPLHQARLTARLTVVEEEGVQALDLELQVVGHTPYPAYEVFVANYFHPALRPGAYVRAQPDEPSLHGATAVEPELHPVYRGMYVAFPRDEAAAALFTDGRWQRGRHWTRFLPARLYAAPLGYYRAASGVDALLMGLPADVAAISMAYAPAGPHSDPVADHHSLYASVWGRDLQPGACWRTVLRLQVGRWGGDAAQHWQAWEHFVATRGERGASLPVPVEVFQQEPGAAP